MSLDDILQEVKNIPDDELVEIMDDLKEWDNVGVTVDEFINYKKTNDN
jgi:uncharacterized FlaG/YvyC family protein